MCSSGAMDCHSLDLLPMDIVLQILCMLTEERNTSESVVKLVCGYPPLWKELYHGGGFSKLSKSLAHALAPYTKPPAFTSLERSCKLDLACHRACGSCGIRTSLAIHPSLKVWLCTVCENWFLVPRPLNYPTNLLPGRSSCWTSRSTSAARFLLVDLVPWGALPPASLSDPPPSQSSAAGGASAVTGPPPPPGTVA